MSFSFCVGAWWGARRGRAAGRSTGPACASGPRGDPDAHADCGVRRGVESIVIALSYGTHETDGASHGNDTRTRSLWARDGRDRRDGAGSEPINRCALTRPCVTHGARGGGARWRTRTGAGDNACALNTSLEPTRSNTRLDSTKTRLRRRGSRRIGLISGIASTRTAPRSSRPPLARGDRRQAPSCTLYLSAKRHAYR